MYPRVVLDRIAALAEADPAGEVCGLVVEEASGLRVVPVPNAAGPGASATAFEMEPRLLLRVLRDLERTGGRVVAIYHSHPESPACLSPWDRDRMLAGGAPLWPGAEQLVVGLRAGRAVETRRYRFTHGDYRAVPLD